MLIDWYTVAAQIINFVVLVFLLKRFLYGRIISAMDRREKRIADRLEEAGKEKARAQEKADAYRLKIEEFERKRNEMTAEAKKVAEAKRSDLEKRAREEVEQARSGWYEAIEHEREEFLRNVMERIVSEVTVLVRKVLSDLANADLEGQMVRSFVSRLEKLGPEQLERFAVGSGDGRLTIRSAYPLGREERSMLEKALSERLGTASPEYVTNENIGPGIVMEVPGLKVGWTAEGYIDDLEQALAQASEPAPSHIRGASRRERKKQEGRPEKSDANGGGPG